jgi:hypothetical protein
MTKSSHAHAAKRDGESPLWRFNLSRHPVNGDIPVDRQKTHCHYPGLVAPPVTVAPTGVIGARPQYLACDCKLCPVCSRQSAQSDLAWSAMGIHVPRWQALTVSDRATATRDRDNPMISKRPSGQHWNSSQSSNQATASNDRALEFQRWLERDLEILEARWSDYVTANRVSRPPNR